MVQEEELRVLHLVSKTNKKGLAFRQLEGGSQSPPPTVTHFFTQGQTYSNKAILVLGPSIFKPAQVTVVFPYD